MKPADREEGKEYVSFYGQKEFKDNRMLRDTTICDDSGETRTHKIFHALEEVCYVFDLGKPIWLEHNIDEFKRHAKAVFTRIVLLNRLILIFWRFR